MAAVQCEDLQGDHCGSKVGLKPFCSVMTFSTCQVRLHEPFGCTSSSRVTAATGVTPSADLYEEVFEQHEGRRRGCWAAGLPGHGQGCQAMVHQSLQQGCHAPLHTPHLQSASVSGQPACHLCQIMADDPPNRSSLSEVECRRRFRWVFWGQRSFHKVRAAETYDNTHTCVAAGGELKSLSAGWLVCMATSTGCRLLQYFLGNTALAGGPGSPVWRVC